jgi:chaperonin GroES
MATDIKIVPLGKRVVIKPQDIQEKTPGGLVIPPSATDDKRPAFGEIVKLGIGKGEDGKVIKFDVKVGDLVYFKRYSPEEIEVDGKEYLVLDAEDIIALVKK